MKTDKHVQYIWHHDIHNAWGREKLNYWRIAFGRGYEVKTVYENILKILKNARIASYVVYTTTGNFDILIRCWVPFGFNKDKFKVKFSSVFHDVTIQSAEVERIEKHWVWEDSTNTMMFPDDNTIDSIIGNEHIEKINNSDISQAQSDEIAMKNIAIEYEPSKGGINFFIIIPARHSGTVEYVVNETTKKICNILQGAKHITEKSFYKCSGFCRYLIKGKVKPSKFSAINTEIIEKFYGIDFSYFSTIRTDTYIAMSPTEKRKTFFEKLPAHSPHKLDKVPTDYLTKYESEHLEVKGSYSFDINRWLHKNEVHQNKKLETIILKNIVGMLNTPIDGIIIIGAVDKVRYADTVGKMGFPETELYYLLGLESELQVTGGTKDWDQFERKVKDMIKENILPPPTGHTRLEAIEYLDKTLCYIYINSPANPQYFLRDNKEMRYFVRDGSEATELRGPQILEYQRDFIKT